MESKTLLIAGAAISIGSATFAYVFKKLRKDKRTITEKTDDLISKTMENLAAEMDQVNTEEHQPSPSNDTSKTIDKKGAHTVRPLKPEETIHEEKTELGTIFYTVKNGKRIVQRFESNDGNPEQSH